MRNAPPPEGDRALEVMRVKGRLGALPTADCPDGQHKRHPSEEQDREWNIHPPDASTSSVACATVGVEHIRLPSGKESEPVHEAPLNVNPLEPEPPG